jgi:hypothetical protein
MREIDFPCLNCGILLRAREFPSLGLIELPRCHLCGEPHRTIKMKEGTKLEIIDRNLYIIHLALSLRNPSFMDFSPFASSLLEEFFKVVWLCDEETAIRLGIEHWYRKWCEIRRHQPPMHILFGRGE